jgi:Flp pilus assembly protein CpaB
MRRLILIVGIVLALLVAGLTALFIQSRQPRYVDVPIAIEDIPAGTVLRDNLFRSTRIANVDRETASKWVLESEYPELAQGKIATSDIKAGFPIGKAQIDPNSSTGFESRLSLAITNTNDYYVVIPATPDQVGNFVQPGDRIDLIITIGEASGQRGLTLPLTPTLQSDVDGQITLTTQLPATKLVMQNMSVLRVERDAPRNANNNQNQRQLAAPEVREVKRLYVKVDRDQLEVLSFVLNNGKRNIAVRAAGGSQEVLATEGVTWEDFVRWFYAQRGNGLVVPQPFRSVGPYEPRGE